MTQRFFILLTLLFCTISAIQAQSFDYNKEWKKIEDLVQKQGRPQTALAEAKKIFQRAKAEKNEGQKVKALVYMSALQDQTREENIITSIKEIEQEIRQSQEPVTSLLKSFQASLYWKYYQHNRWNLYNRTQTIQFNKEDIATWSIEDFHRKISSLYLESIKNKTLLQQVKPQAFEPVIDKGNVRHLRPTLYDLLAHQALDYFRNDERDIKKPSYAFEIDQPTAFAPALNFITVPFNTRDSLSLLHKALEIYQELVALHLKNENPEALMDVDIQRLSFVYNHSTHEAKDSLYKEALESIIEKHKGSRLTYQAQYMLAQYYNQRSNNYPQDTSYRLERIKAKNIVEKIVKDSAVKNEGWTNSYNLYQQIIHKNFSFEIEKVNLPSIPFRALVRYRNLSALHFRLIRSNEETKKLMERGNRDDYWKKILEIPVLASWQQPIPDPGDFMDHRVEVKINALPIGEYILVASSGDDFNLKNEMIGAQAFIVSELSYAFYNNAFYILHRQSGQPVAGAKLDLYFNTYDYKKNQYIKTKSGSYTSDSKGFIQVTHKEENYQPFLIGIYKGNDTLSLQEHLYNYRSYDEEKQPARNHIFFFTDRAIYRPGQQVYFKGIVLKKEGKNNTINPGFSSTVYLRNANYQLVDSITLTTNEFGSFSGKFNLPSTGLTGAFFISDQKNENAQQFLVEEYKRPKFFIEFDKIEEEYKLGGEVKISGVANAYAGNVIDGAKVNYRVVRQPRFMYPWRMYRSWLPPSPPMEIKNGVTTTDNQGKFTISFTLIPDRKIDPALDPLFDYIIYADVTDISGETRSNEKRITAGYKSLVLQLEVPSSIHADSLKKISVRTENLNGGFQSSKVTIHIRKLLPENRLIRKRYWERPDQFIMSKAEYISLFPNDEYFNETDPQSWEKGEMVLSATDTTSAAGFFPINKKLEPGFYEVVAVAKDREGREVKNVAIIEMYNQSGAAKPDYFIFRPADKAIEPGESVSTEVGSSTDIHLVRHVDKVTADHKVINEKAIDHYNINGLKTFTYTATEADRGGFGVYYFFVKDNRFYIRSDVIVVPWTNKDLSISFETFRDKTLPGSEERWKIKIAGNKNEKVAAEMLAAMYDASLDQFVKHSWNKPSIWPTYHVRQGWTAKQNFSSVTSQQNSRHRNEFRNFKKEYDRLIFGQYASNGYGTRYGIEESLQGNISGVVTTAAPPMARQSNSKGLQDSMESQDMTMKGEELKLAVLPGNTLNEPFQPRTNFNETAFFFPDLRTDADGNIEFSFTLPDALTRWKFLSVAHTKQLALGMAEKEIITQKELMVQPNMPRFIRQGDKIEMTTKIVNLSDKEMTGQVQLELLDAATNQPVDGWFMNTFPNQYFTVAAGQSDVASFPIQVPFQYNKALTWRITASSGNFRDGEENILPVLSNRLLVTETLPLHMRGDGTKSFSFDKLKNAASSGTLQHHKLVVEYTSNPVWFVVQALPFLAEPKYESSEQIWNRYYANALASMIANSSPRLKAVFEKWRTTDTAALISNLQKNPELKSILLEETPWVLAAQSETEQKKNIAILFDMVRLSSELGEALQKLKSMQAPNGGFVWFKGGPDDRYMTQYIVTGIGRLKKLGIQTNELSSILDLALPYLDRKIKEDYDRLVKSKADLTKKQISYIQIHYLYMRSFYTNRIPASSQVAYNYFMKQAGQHWVKENKYMQGMLALVNHRSGNHQTAKNIIRSLKETSLNDAELGMYWKEIRFGYGWSWWYAPIETQSLLIEAFSEVAKDGKAVDDMKTWLVKNKQTNHWRTSKATADACYAMLMQGTDWISNEPVVNINLGNKLFQSTDVKTESGTGYFKIEIPQPEIVPAMGNIDVSVSGTAKNPNSAVSAAPSWGAVYWQYFQDMDKIESAATPLKLHKKLFIERSSDRGPVIQPLNEGMELKVGDKVVVRIELRSDRDMEYVHMKDLRSAAFEPVNVLSSYKWQGRLGYYESTRDAATNFFFHYLPKGTYVFEYAVFVTHKGEFNNGITTIQSMYAPEFSAHSEGVKVRVE